MISNTTEKDYQNTIINYLENHGYQHRNTKNYKTNLFLDAQILLTFIQNTQKKNWDRFNDYYGKNAEKKFLNILINKIKTHGTIKLLREGFRDSGMQFNLFYPKPNNNRNPELFEKFERNIFSVIDELEYEDRENGNRLDLVIFINGIPISTIELKDTFSQGVSKAVRQYRNDRDPREQLFKNCLVHFAMSDEKIFMTTQLDGYKTSFLPFNKGIVNPVVEGEYKTSYLYKEILSKDNISRLISNFIFVEDEKIIFPRYHQLDCVNKLMQVATPGSNYLIQHSAGSGKTKTIAWLAHNLLKRFDTLDKRVYDMVIVISDRKVIDKQLREQILYIEKTKGVVQVIDKDSKQLAEALKSGTNIVVTTLQKFPHILNETADMPERKYAVIIDEAHSSQSGSLAREMHKVLGTNDVDEEIFYDAEDAVDRIILENLERSRNMDNISFFAFTATPKNKTLEMFGTRNEFDQFYPFHEYTMEQAIEEKFILDVLENYLTYPTYFKLMKKIVDDPEISTEKAKRMLKKFVEMHPHAISTKVGIMLTHFIEKSSRKINGKARAMVVTGSRIEAVRYKKEFDAQIKDQGIKNLKTLVAFTGTVNDRGSEYTESSMNDISESIENAFEKDPYRILIVANKYQTGFDEPLLHTMYVDKKLRDIKAVQTLSRLNRIYPGKEDTLVMDFANSADDIAKAFEKYYQTTFLTEESQTYKLYDLMETIYEFLIFDRNEVNGFVKALFNDEDQSKLHNLLSPVIDEFNSRDFEIKTIFKRTIRKFQNIYSFLSQLMPFSDKELEKLYIYNRYLYKKLPSVNPPFIFDVDDDVDIDSYKIDDEQDVKSIALNPDGAVSPSSPSPVQYHEDETSPLSQIINDLNEEYGTEFSDEDKVMVDMLLNNLGNNEELIKRINNNSRENVEAVFSNFFDDEMGNLMVNNFNFFKKINDNEEIRNSLENMILNLLYSNQEVEMA